MRQRGGERARHGGRRRAHGARHRRPQGATLERRDVELPDRDTVVHEEDHRGTRAVHLAREIEREAPAPGVEDLHRAERDASARSRAAARGGPGERNPHHHGHPWVRPRGARRDARRTRRPPPHAPTAERAPPSSRARAQARSRRRPPRSPRRTTPRAHRRAPPRARRAQPRTARTARAISNAPHRARRRARRGRRARPARPGRQRAERTQRASEKEPGSRESHSIDPAARANAGRARRLRERSAPRIAAPRRSDDVAEVVERPAEEGCIRNVEGTARRGAHQPAQSTAAGVHKRGGGSCGAGERARKSPGPTRSKREMAMDDQAARPERSCRASPDRRTGKNRPSS